MKKNLIISTLVVCCIVFFASCVVIKKTESGNTRNVVGIGVIQAPTIANLEVSSIKVTELFTVKTKNSFFGMIKKNEAGLLEEKTISDVKAHSIAKLLVKHNADVLIEPRFSIETVSTKKTSTYNIIVTGYPATYKNFRPLVPADTSLLKIYPYTTEPIRLIGTLINE